MSCGLTETQYTSVCQAANIGSEVEKTFDTGRPVLVKLYSIARLIHVQWCTLEHQLPVLYTMFPGRGILIEQFLACHGTEVILACLTNFYPTYSVEETPAHVCGEEGLQGIHACCPRGSIEHTRLSWTWRGSNVENIFVSLNCSVQ